MFYVYLIEWRLYCIIGQASSYKSLKKNKIKQIHVRVSTKPKPEPRVRLHDLFVFMESIELSSGNINGNAGPCYYALSFLWADLFWQSPIF